MAQRVYALVTGGGGFLGSAIARLLIAQGAAVRSLSRRRYPALDRLGVEQIQGDISDRHIVHKACEGVQVVFHTAAKVGNERSYQAYFDTNVLGTRNVINACLDCCVSRLIHTSSPSVIFNGSDMEGIDESTPYPTSFHAHYPNTKAQAEKEVLSAVRQGLPAVILRPHLIWGPGDNQLVPHIVKRAARLRRIGDGTNRVDTIYIDNAARAHLLADTALKTNPALAGKVYFISQDDPIPVWEMVNHILAAAGKSPIRKSISPGLAYSIGYLCELAYRVLRLDGTPFMTRFIVRELATAHWFDISAAKRELGYTPIVSTAEGLERLARWFKENNNQQGHGSVIANSAKDHRSSASRLIG